MNDYQIDSVLNILFYNFEQNLFINDGIWPRQVNLVFAFADYIEAMSEEDIIPFIPKDAQPDLKAIKNRALQGINLWLQQNMKTLMM